MRSMTEGLSVRFPNALSPPSLRDTSPYHKGRQGERTKTQGRQSIAQQIRVSPVPSETSPVKTRRRVAHCVRSRKVHRSDFTLQGHPQKCPQEIFGEEEKPQGGLGGQASLVCLPASARFDEVRAQDAPLYAFRSTEQKSYR